MRFKEFLTEKAASKKPRFDPHLIKEASDILNKYCKDAIWMLQKDHPIYRGQKSLPHNRDFYTIDPSKTERKSQNTSNHYTVILDNIESMSDFPKRSRSLIGSFDESNSDQYGAVYALIPFDGVKIGCVKSDDLWETEIRFFGRTSPIEVWNDVFHRDFNIDDTWKSFQKFQEKLNAGDDGAIRAFRRIFNGADPTQFLEELNKAYSPARTKFEVRTTKTMPRKMDGEVWVGGKCLMMPKHIWDILVMAHVEGSAEYIFGNKFITLTSGTKRNKA